MEILQIMKDRHSNRVFIDKDIDVEDILDPIRYDHIGVFKGE